MPSGSPGRCRLRAFPDRPPDHGRSCRVNNTRPAFIKVLVCEETIDERVQQIVETKKELGEYLVDGVGDGTVDTRLAEELRSIIRDL